MVTPTSPKAARGPGRPRASDGPAVSREDLLQIASRAIAERGFERTSIRGIANEAGVSMRTVQHHFPTKDDIWRALIDDVVVPETVSRVSQDAADIPDTVEREVALRIERAMTRPGLSAAVLTDTSKGARDRLEYVAAATAEMQRANLLTLRSHMDAGALRSMDPRSLAIAVSIGLACVSSAKTAVDVLYDVDLDDDAQRETLIQDITDLVLYGLLPREDKAEP
jgi:TetR/AcrR family transcriptional regulator